jgi:predicted DsbA family dithiol-disulfide isomerase
MQRARMLIDMVADPVCPWCYVGLMSLRRSREALAAEFDIETRFRAYELNPDVPENGVDRQDFYRRRFPDAARLAAAREAIKEAAEGAGFSFDPALPPLLPNTRRAHQLLRFAHRSGRQDETAGNLYAAFWRDLRDIGNRAALAQIAATSGLDRDAAIRAIESADEAAAAAAEAQAFRRAGVSAVPTFIVNEKFGFSGGLPPDRLAAALRRAATPEGIADGP